MKRASESRGGSLLAVEGFFQSVAQGLSESYVSALMVWLGAGSVMLGLVGTLPTAATALAQVVAARMKAGARGPRTFIAGTWLAHGTALAVIGGLAVIDGPAAVPLVCAVAVTAWLVGGASVPAWTSLVSQTVPRARHGWFFGLRGATQQVGVVVAILGGGAILSAATARGATAMGFLVVFVLAGLFRGAGSALLAGVPVQRPAAIHAPFRSLIAILKDSAKLRRLALFLWVLHFSTWVAAPFYLPYMLRDLHFDYAGIGLLLAVPAVVKSLTMRFWGGVADRLGPGRLLRLMGWCVLPVSGLWLVSGQFWWIGLAQAYAGLIWGAFELAQASALLQTTRGREDAVALFNLVDGGAMILGSIVGGLIVVGADRFVGGVEPLVAGAHRSTGSGFLMAIAASTVARALTVLLLQRRVRSLGVPSWSHRNIPLRLWGVRATRGASLRPWGELPPPSE